MSMMDEITAEYAVADLLPAAELKALAKCTVAAKTDLGRVRENNEDKFEFYVPDDEVTLASRGQVFVVCDGMGGHAAGQIASELSCKTFIDVYLNHPAADVKDALVEAVQAANRYVFLVSRSVAARKGMGTTMTAMVLLQNKAYFAQVGDSRAYRLRGDELTQITEDHTYMHEMIRMGVLTPEQAAVHPQKHVITRAIGIDEQVQCDVYEFEIHEGDTYFLCSDGVLNHVEDDQIQQILTSNGPAAAAWKMVGAALLGGGSDNTTAIVVKVDELQKFD
jgi:serine/threonine protein phosphatase PrpC